MQSIKEHNLKANHNTQHIVKNVNLSVCNLSKNTIWKQITTVAGYLISEDTLYAIYQRTQSESKSQPRLRLGERFHSVCNLSKNTIWKQITTAWYQCQSVVCLYAIYQRTQSESKSQPFGILYTSSGSVCNLSKNTIWKQITTIPGYESTGGNLYAIYQRTQSESKSQQDHLVYFVSPFCMQSIKEHNLKANHNRSIVFAVRYYSVCNLSKNTIWKQITTLKNMLCQSYYLYAIYQRTQSESKSQLSMVMQNIQPICMQSIKEHNLKANHNNVDAVVFEFVSVCNLSKNTIWKQITTVFEIIKLIAFLYAIYQRTQSESKSQPDGARLLHVFICMQSIKEHNLKANHNIVRQVPQDIDLYAIYQRTQSESKSQQNHRKHPEGNFCMQSIKEHNLKANHNRVAAFELTSNLYAIYQRTQSESKSQLFWKWSDNLNFCMQSIKEHNLKANHNNSWLFTVNPFSVCNLSKNTIWKQITTSLP